MKVKVKTENGAVRLPEYASESGEVFNVFAFLNVPVDLMPGQIKLISTGLTPEIPKGYELRLSSVPQLSLVSGLVVLNQAGYYTEKSCTEVNIVLANFSNETKTINRGDVIAQCSLSRIESIEFEALENFSNTYRFRYPGKLDNIEN